MLERILKKAAAVVFDNYRRIALLFAILTTVSIVMVFRMEIRTDLIDVLPKGEPSVAQFRDFMQKYDILESVTVIVSSTTNSIEENADLIETLGMKLGQSSLVERVDYSALYMKNELFVKRFPLFLDEMGLRQLSGRLSSKGIERQIRMNYEKLMSPVASPADTELIELDPLNIREIIAESMKRSGPDNPFDLSLGYYMTKDHSTALIFVKPSGRSRDMAFVRKLRPELEDIVRSAVSESGSPRDVSVQLTGGHIFSDDVRRVIRHDIIGSTLLSVVLIALVLWLAYRVRPIVLLIVACTTLASLSMTLAVAYLIFGSLNIVTSIVCGLLIGMYVDYCILTLKRFGDELLVQNDRAKALELTMTKAGASMVMSAVTTAISFFSIIVTRFEGLYELGVVSGIGVLICFFTTFFFMNALLVWAGSRGAASIVNLKEPASGVGFLSRIIEKYPGRIVCGSALLIIMLAVGLTQLSFDNNPDHIGIRNSQAVAAMKAINQKLRNSGEPLEVMIRAGDIGELNNAFGKLETDLVQWKKEGLISRADSLGSLIPPPQTQARLTGPTGMMSNLFGEKQIKVAELEAAVVREMDRFGIAFDRGKLRGYLTSIIEALKKTTPVGLNEIDGVSDPRIKRFYNKQDMSIVAYLYSGPNGWDGNTIDALSKGVREEGIGWSLIGSPILYPDIKASILRGSALAAVITLGLNLLFVLIFLKGDKGYALFAMLPVCLGFVLTPAIMGWLGAPLNFMNIGTMALIFGFGVDYGIYIMQSYLREDIRDVNNALRLSGKNVMMCAATTIAGCGSLITAEFAGMASVGLVLTIGAVCCSAITIILLPSLLWLRKRKDAVSG